MYFDSNQVETNQNRLDLYKSIRNAIRLDLFRLLSDIPIEVPCCVTSHGTAQFFCLT